MLIELLRDRLAEDQAFCEQIQQLVEAPVEPVTSQNSTVTVLRFSRSHSVQILTGQG